MPVRSQPPALVQRAAGKPSGQSLVEFALILPVLMTLVIAIADFARFYSTAVAIEAAAREAADYGAFTTARWAGDPTDPNSNYSKTVVRMQELACTASSEQPDYQGDPVGTPSMTCTNPAFAWSLTGTDCSNNDPTATPCHVTVTLSHTFNLFLPTPFFAPSITFSRDSTFAVSQFPSS